MAEPCYRCDHPPGDHGEGGCDGTLNGRDCTCPVYDDGGLWHTLAALDPEED